MSKENYEKEITSNNVLNCYPSILKLIQSV